MSLDFGKLDFVVSLDRKTAFPLDAKSYFESFASAEAAARTAEAAGSKNTAYYFGQTICVVENNIASMYIIQPDGTLGEVGGKIEIDEKQFTLENGSLSLLGFANAVEGAQPVKTADGSIEWRKPDNSIVEGIQEAIGVPSSEGVEATGIYAELEKKANAENVYSKNETDQAIASAIANVSHLKREIFESKIAAENAMADYGDSADQYIYMVARVETEDGNYYDEYMAFKNADEEWVLEKIGDWGVDLNNYVTTEQLNNEVEALEKIIDEKVDKVYYQISVKDEEGNPAYDNEGNPIYETVEGSLLTPEDKEKLAALVIDENGSVGISGTVNAENVEGLGSWITNNGSTFIDNLTESNLSSSLINKINYITSVDVEVFNVEEGNLQLLSNVKSSLNSLQTILEANADDADALYLITADEKTALSAVVAGDFNNYISSIDEETFKVTDGKLELINAPASALTAVVGDITLITNYQEGNTIVDEINNIYDILTWVEIS